MRNKVKFEMLVWVIIPLIFFPLLGLLPYPSELGRAMKSVRDISKAGDSLSASNYIAQVAEGLPWRESLWESAGLAALESGTPLFAIQYLIKADENGIISDDGYIALGDAYQRIGNFSEALKYWQIALDNGATPIDIHLRKLNAYRSLSDISAAIDELRIITRLDPANAQFQYQLGLMIASREPEAALVHLLQAKELDKDLTEAVRVLQNKIQSLNGIDDPAFSLLNAGRALGLIGEWKLAIEAFSLATQLSPNYAEAWAFLGEAQWQYGGNGVEALEKAIELDPDSLIANALFGLYHKRHGNPEIALVYLHSAARIEPDNPSIQAEIGSTLNDLGDFNGALLHYQRATQLAPREQTFWHLLSLFSLQNNTQVEEIGLAAARRALLLREDDPIALDLMGYGYYLLNDMVSSRRFLQRALDADQGYGPAHLHLGLVELVQGNLSEARRHLVEAINLVPGTSTSAQAERVLDRYFP